MNLFGFNITRERRPTPADLVLREHGASAHAPEQRGAAALRHQISDIWGGSGLSSSGLYVSEESAMRLAAVYACVRVLAESVASLPLKLYRRDGKRREPATDHPLYTVLHDQANDLMTAMEYREVQMVHLGLWGNHYAEKQRNGRGDVVALWPIPPQRVTPKLVRRSGSGATLTTDARRDVAGGMALEYHVRLDEAPDLILRQEEVYHVKALGTNGLVGKSPVTLHRESMGMALAAERFGSKFFANDTRSGVYLHTEQALSDDQFQRLKEEWQGYEGPDRAWRTKILEGGLKVDTLSMPMKDAQFLETRKYQRGEVASIYRVPPHLIGDLERATYSNIEHQSIEFVVHTLRPWLVRIEQALALSCLTPQERRTYYASHVVDGLLRGDTESRFNAYATARNWGWLSADDIRALEDMNPLPDGQGEVYLQPLNMVPAGQFGADGASGSPEPAPVSSDGQRGELPTVRANAPGVNPPERRAVPSRVTSAQALQPVFLDTIARVVRRGIAEIQRAVERLLVAGDSEGFMQWLDTFADEHAAWMEPRVRPLFASMAEAMAAAAAEELDSGVTADDLSQFILDYSEAYANRHAGSSSGQIRALLDEREGELIADITPVIEQRLSEWDDTRAGKEARQEGQRSSNAITKAIWTILGVTTVTWRTTGSDTCPYCEELSGRTASITSKFLEAGASIADFTTRSPVGHPPLHQGCDCYLDVATSLRSVPDPAERRAALDLILSGAAAPLSEHEHPIGHRHA